MRCESAQILAELGDPQAIEPLIMALADPDKAVQQAVIKALASFGERACARLVSLIYGIMAAIEGQDEPLKDELLAKWEFFSVYETDEDDIDSHKTLREITINNLTYSSLEDTYKAELVSLLKKSKAFIIINGILGTLVSFGKIAVPSVMELATHPSNDLRVQATRSLIPLADPQSFDLLVKLLDDCDKSVREMAIAALGAIGEPRAIALFIQRLDKLEWYSLVEVFAAHGEASIEPLLECLKNSNEDIRGKALYSLTTFGNNRRVFDSAIACLKDTSDEVRARAVDILGEINDKRAIEPLVNALGDVSFEVRRSAVLALGEIGDERAVEPLIATLNDESPDVCRYAIKALGELKDKRAIEPLLNCLTRPSVCVDALDALDDIAQTDEGLFQALLKILFDPQWNGHNYKIAEIFAKFGDRALTSALSALQNPDEKVRDRAIDVLNKLEDPRAIEPLLTIFANDPSNLVKNNALYGLGKFHEPRAFEPALATLNDDELRGTAVTTLGDIGDKRAFEPLLKLLQEADIHDYANIYLIDDIVEAMGKLKEPRAFEPLLAVLENTEIISLDYTCPRGMVAELFGKWGDLRAVEPLIQALTDDDGLVRYSAIEALGKLSDERALPALEWSIGNDIRYDPNKTAAEKTIARIKGTFVEANADDV